MSHDRGCSCGKEPYEYSECRMQGCPKAGHWGGRHVSEGSQYIGLTIAELEDIRKQSERIDRMDANSRQVGGSHYRKGTGEQHWDVVDRFQVPYLEGVGSKYPLRWREKGGVEDLEKTLHYIDKILERPHDHELWDRWHRLHTDLVTASNRLCDDHQIGPIERRTVLALLQGVTRDTMIRVRADLDQYIRGLRATTSPGSPEDGGHHAQQAEAGEEAQSVDLTVTERHLHLHLPEGCSGSLTVSGEQAVLKWGRP